MIKRAAVVYAANKPAAVKMASDVAGLLARMGVSNSLLNADSLFERQQELDSDLVIVLGGDGTILKSIHSLPNPDTPILGINFGRGGYLAEVEPPEALEAIESVVKGEIETEDVVMLSVYANDKKLGDIVNEVYVSHEMAGKVIEFELSQDDDIMLEGVADGVLISTPLGSTAYAMSAGGPAVDHRLEVVVVVPVCPLSRMSPLILSLAKPIYVMLKVPRAQVLLDGQIRATIGRDIIKIERSQLRSRFVRVVGEDSFVRRLRKRLRGRV